MEYLKLLLVFILSVMLTACGETFEGTYEEVDVDDEVTLRTGTAVLEHDRIQVMGPDFRPVSSWKRDGNVVTAFDQDGQSVLRVREEDDGKTLVVMDLPGSFSVTLTRKD